MYVCLSYYVVHVFWHFCFAFFWRHVFPFVLCLCRFAAFCLYFWSLSLFGAIMHFVHRVITLLCSVRCAATNV